MAPLTVILKKSEDTSCSLLFHYGMVNKSSQRVQVSNSVAIILGPSILRAWNTSRKPHPITSASNSNFPGNMISVTLCFPNRSNNKIDKYHKRGKGVIKIFLSSIYHLV